MAKRTFKQRWRNEQAREIPRTRKERKRKMIFSAEECFYRNSILHSVLSRKNPPLKENRFSFDKPSTSLRYAFEKKKREMLSFCPEKNTTRPETANRDIGAHLLHAAGHP